MKSSLSAAVLVLALASPALADFAGQTILGPLTNGASVNGNNAGASDDNDGWYSGDHIFDIWNGGDDVWALNWTGGNMSIELSYDNFECDPDLFLYIPGHLDESSYDSYTNGVDSVTLADAPAGTYYILIDSSAGSEGPYHLNVVPAPTSVAVFALGTLGAVRRTRRER